MKNILYIGLCFFLGCSSTSQVEIQYNQYENIWHNNEVAISFGYSINELCHKSNKAIKSSMSTWQNSGAILPVILFNNSDDLEASYDGINSISASEIEIPGPQNDLAITISYTNSDSKEILEADIIINAKYSYTTSDNCDEEYDLQNIMTHEFGHLFGLHDDFTNNNSTMYIKSAHCETNKRDLYYTDLENIVNFYGTKQ